MQRRGEVITLARSVKGAQSSLETRLSEVRGRIQAAAGRSGRASGSVTLVAVVKTVAPDQVAAAIALGVRDLGENRVQEAEGKIAAVGRAGADATALRWHLIGHLQRNKAARPAFAGLRTLRDAAERKLHLKLAVLSMGMSGDYEVAVEEGATLVRIGTALFGSRA